MREHGPGRAPAHDPLGERQETLTTRLFLLG
jgi:hypothetical protein